MSRKIYIKSTPRFGKLAKPIPCKVFREYGICYVVNTHILWVSCYDYTLKKALNTFKLVIDAIYDMPEYDNEYTKRIRKHLYGNKNKISNAPGI